MQIINETTICHKKNFIMKQQMVFRYDASGYASDNKKKLDTLLSEEWVIVQISSIDKYMCWMLLEKEVNNN